MREYLVILIENANGKFFHLGTNFVFSHITFYLANIRQQYGLLCPFAVYYLRYAATLFFTLSRISLVDGKRAGQNVQRKIAAAVQNVKRLYFLSRSFEISETNCQQSFFLP